MAGNAIRGIARIKPADPSPVQPVRRGITMAPSGGVRVVATGLRQRGKSSDYTVGEFVKYGVK